MTRASQNYRQILQGILESRCQKNPRYSLRSFARDIGISAPRLSRVLNGHHGLSKNAAQEIAAKLNLSEAERELFATLVESEHARAATIRTTAQKRAQELSSAFTSLGLDSFRVISDWYHLAILELTIVDGFKSDATWIASQLGITRIQAHGAIERLLRLDLLEQQDGVLRATGSNFVNLQGLPSEAVRKFHTQVLTLAQHALEFQSVEEREFSNLMVAIDPEYLPSVRKQIRELVNRVNTEASAPSLGRKKRVYNLSIQFFGLSSNPNQEPS